MSVRKIAVITLFPEMFSALTESGITGRAVKNGLIELVLINPREFASDKHKTVDDRPYGGGPGMVMSVEPLQKAVAKAVDTLGVLREELKVIYLSPQGRRLSQSALPEIEGHMIIVAGRYEGVDERFIEMNVDEEWSIGDYVLSGGELPAMVLMDALIRRIPGALGDEQSAEQDSFEDGLLDFPHYTRPEKVKGKVVPEVLLSGDHKRIAEWRQKQALVRTFEKRPELLAEKKLTEHQQKLLDEYLLEQGKK